jgi:hypothetical protein
MDRLLDIAKRLPAAPDKRRNSWFTQCTPQQQKEIDELIEQWKAGRLRDKFPDTTHLSRFIASQPYIKVEWLAVRRTVEKRLNDTR